MAANFSNIGVSFPNATSAADNDAGFLLAGDQLALQLQTDADVDVTGNPFLQVANGHIATYDAAGSTGSSVNFIYTVQPGDSTNDFTVDGLNLNGGTITARDDGSALQGFVSADVGVVVDAVQPSFTISPGIVFSSPGTVTFSGTASDNVGATNVEVFAAVGSARRKSDLGSADVDADGNWSLTVDFGGPLKISRVSAETSDPDGNAIDVTGVGTFSTGEGNTYIYKAGSGPVLIENFQLTGANHDVLSFSKSEVPSFTSLAAVIAATHNLPGGGVEIPLGNGDSLTFGNLTKNQVKAEALRELQSHNVTDFKFV